MRLLATAVITLISNAIGLLVADLVLEDVSVTAAGFTIAVITFTVVSVLTEPLLRQAAMRNAPALLGSSALITVLVGLVVTSFFGNSLTISGLMTWVLTTVIVWIAAFAGRLLLPMVIFKKALASSDR